jgi:hypothetical protein
MTIGSRREYRANFGRHCFAMLDAICDHAKSERFRLRPSLACARAIGQHTGERRHFADPTAVSFLLNFNPQHRQSRN